MANRMAFIDFVHGLLHLNPLERWSPQQAKMHPFITQQKFQGPFVPPMNMKTSSRSPAPGVQQQQQAEAVSKQRHQAQQAAQIQAQNAAALNAMQMQQYQQPSHMPVNSPGLYPGMYGQHQGAPPPYPTQNTGPYNQPMGMMHAQQMHGAYPQQSNLHAQATARASRQRATTMDQQGGGIPPTLQRVVSHLDPNHPIRLQPSPAYYPPPDMGPPDATPVGQARRNTRQRGQSRGNANLIRNLEDRSIDEGYMMGNNQGWH